MTLHNVPRALVTSTGAAPSVLVQADTGRLLGVQAVAADAGDLIQSSAIARRARMTVHDLEDQFFPY